MQDTEVESHKREIDHIKRALVQLIDLGLREEGVSLIPKGWWRHEPNSLKFIPSLMKGEV
jgi:hypothetical protein